MSRPTTRSKNKRRQEDNVNITSEILRKIHATSEITNDDVNQLYMIGKPACQGCRVNTKDNPNCFCGLIPPPNGSRKSGLWQKLSDIVQALGPDPCKDLRASAGSPAGLTNLGATCYANSILQCLYMNTSFREGVFSVESEVLKQQPVLDQLARLFAQLHASKMAFIDSAPFIKTLELDNGVQQDSHEFLTLLLSLLERCLSHSKVSKARTIVQDLFCGSVSHVTTCSKCGQNSEASSKMEDFYELELNVKGLKNLDESLDDYLSVEELHGENQYFCELCKMRVDAIRSIKLRTLPDVLNFQLKRCVFLPKTTTKKKITSAFCFPGVLDMRQRLSESSMLDWIYDLSAVLIHKGTAVNSGHYTAHIKDENTGQWWEFDDEHVSNLGLHPFGEGSSTSTSKVVNSEPPAGIEEIHVVTNGNHIDTAQPQSLKPSTDSLAGTFSSNDAYMLMYTLRRTKKVDEKRPVVCGDSKIELESNESSSHETSLPSHLFEDIKNLNASYLDACERYKMKKEKEVNNIAERRQEVRSVLAEAPVRSFEAPCYWVSVDWLRQWADNVTPTSSIDNTPIQCSHGKVPVSKVGSMKRLSAEAWTKLFSKYGGGPKLTNDDYCMACLIDGAKSVVCADSYRDRRALMRDLASDVLAGNCLDGTYYVSKTWLQQWVRRKNLDAPSEGDAGPTVPIRCPHGQLMPEQASGAKRLLVPEKLWLFFYEDAIAVKPDDPLGCTTFPSDSEQCLQCCDELSEVACLEDSLRAMKLKQRQNHEKLAMGKGIPLSLYCKYYLVPSSWLAKWRNYVTASGKNLSSSVEPETLDFVIDSLKCEKHLRLLERPPDLVFKRGILFQKGSTTDGLTIITENDWNNFCEEWSGSKDKGIFAIIEPSNVAENNLAGSCEEIPINEEHLNPQDEVNNETETRQPIIRTCPEICEDCIGERESCKLMQKLNYSNEDIYVSLVHGKEAPRSVLEASETNSEPDRRASKRSRKTSYGNSVNLKVSGSTSIYQLKMMIWESLGVVKENQILHKGSKIIDQECATLADLNIFPGDKLWVQDSEIHEHRDIADELADQKMNKSHAEEGFRGTLLTAADISSEVV
ncbi:ubiquitin carboxyl-terminal hydrolase 26 isoform X1 [Jatropha curcas]|uniref:ubiquitin carboxyl-terminal hydrolase 26 isoform X1 n=1 Tax=Jatropha curcas TaxID=180498 RepID=UPI0005FBD6D3|nr:ubiquitin carboxyl-terminal hydrolase 26 isoform X1 [Jatropha curcas]XP_037495088.1 ubiquitin carboxyl-terminal hydrolase 26 isoform X1 [Jatropha curcas]